jgi:hypothetical protein
LEPVRWYQSVSTHTDRKRRSNAHEEFNHTPKQTLGRKRKIEKECLSGNIWQFLHFSDGRFGTAKIELPDELDGRVIVERRYGCYAAYETKCGSRRRRRLE